MTNTEVSGGRNAGELIHRADGRHANGGESRASVSSSEVKTEQGGWVMELSRVKWKSLGDHELGKGSHTDVEGSAKNGMPRRALRF